MKKSGFARFFLGHWSNDDFMVQNQSPALVLQADHSRFNALQRLI
jgi:hypothetical protein